jgi:hypothetical protein
MKKAGVSPYNVSARNIHILPPDYYKREGLKDTIATTVPKYQAVTFDALYVRQNNVCFGNVIFHELMHLKSHFALEVGKPRVDEKEPKKTEFRGGLGIKAAQKIISHGKYHEHFRGLNEALISSREKSFYEEMMKLPLFEKERDWLLSSKVQEIKKKIAKEDGVSEKDILWVRPDSKDYEIISYPRQRAVLSFITKEIQKEFSEKYKSSDEVSSEFLKSFFTGRLLPVARLVERTFGEGSFEVLGMMGADQETAVSVLEYLKRARARCLKLKSKNKPI